MQWVPGILVVVVISHIGGGVTKKTSNPNDGISQFWADDYKVFDQIYGKTSDRDIYGVTVPPSFSYGLDLSQLQQFKPSQVTEKKERYPDNDGQNTDLASAEVDYGFGQKYPYNNLLAKEAIKALNKNPTKTPLKFLATDYKPISQTSDPETYNYLKHLEKLQKTNLEYPGAVTGFQPYATYGSLDYGGGFHTNHESNDAYKSIQDIIEAHEANKANSNESSEEEEEEEEYVPPKNKNKNPPKSVRNKKQKPRKPAPSSNKPRCPSGRCRKRSPSSYRVYRPYIRRIKKVYY